MLVCETAGAEPHDVETLAVLASQLAAAGVDARIHVEAIAEDLHRNVRFDLAPFLFDRPLGGDDTVLLVAAHRLTDERLLSLRRLGGDGARRCVAVGAFDSRQAIIGARAKLSYVFGADPDVWDLGGGAGSAGGVPIFGAPVSRQSGRLPRLILVAPALTEPVEARAVRALALSDRMDVAVLTDGAAKQAWKDANGSALPIYHFGEVLPAGLAQRMDICVVMSRLKKSYRLQSLLANGVVSGAALVDGTEGHVLAAESDAFVPGPPGVGALAPFLSERVLPNLRHLAMQRHGTRAYARLRPDAVLERLDVRAPAPAAPPGRIRAKHREAARVVFMPTNGIGLGHAKRCAQIATMLDRQEASPVFAAFPGCTGLIKSYGFDVMPLVSRSPLHARSYENDLPNYLRLRALTGGAGVVAFDGGYVFDSVYRTVVEAGVRGVWIRRGLWQPGQDNSVALDREKAFARVIVPSEPFEELNEGYSHGERVHPVGPIVTPTRLTGEERRALRDGLAERCGRPFKHLVVSLLGAGVAADRSAQIQALNGMMERRANVLHLVIVWPSAVVQPGWYGWKNTRIVKTVRAGTFAAAADLAVSAAGYNSFLEMLYGAVPTIFLPQVGPFMDDQRARASAAAERGAAYLVEPSDLLRLARLVERCLDEGEGDALRERLQALALPATGTAAAARLIEDLSHER